MYKYKESLRTSILKMQEDILTIDFDARNIDNQKKLDLINDVLAYYDIIKI